MTAGQAAGLSLLSSNPTFITVEDNHGTPPEQRQSSITRHSSLLAQRCGRPAQELVGRGIGSWSRSQTCLQFSLGFITSHPRSWQHDPGFRTWGAYGQLQPLDNAILWRPCHAWCTAGRPLTQVISIMMCSNYLGAPHFIGFHATGARYLLGGATRANGEDSGRGAIQAILARRHGNPWGFPCRITTSTD